MSRQLFVHAGAHRTGTSSFQACLSANRARLGAMGYDVAYPARDGQVGGKLRMRLPRPRHKAADLPEFVAKVRWTLGEQISADRGKLILSEENLTGVILHYFRGKLYPNRKMRLQVFREALKAIEGEVKHILYVVRPYDQLFVSGFRKHAEDNPVKPFQEHADAMSRFAGGWPETVASLRSVLRPEKLTVVSYGARGESRALLARMIGGAPEPLEEPARDLNTSATDRALEELQALYHAGAKLKRGAWQKVIAEHAAQREDRGFAKFTPEQSERLKARYAEDMERLAALDGVDLIT